MMLNSALAYLSLAGAQGGQLPATPVTYTNVGVRAEFVAADLTRASGVRMTVDPAIAREVLVLHVKNAPLDQVMKRMAFATYGQWRRTDDGWQLVRTSEAIRRCQEHDESRYAEDFRAQLREKLTFGKRRAPFDAAAANQLIDSTKALYRRIIDGQSWKNVDLTEYYRTEASAPEAVATFKLIATLDPATLVALRDGAGVIYSSEPNRSERPLPVAARQILDGMNREQAVLYHELRLVPRTAHNVNDPLPGAAPTAANALLYVHMDRSRGKEWLQIESFFFDAQGRSAGDDNQSFILGPAKDRGADGPLKEELAPTPLPLMAQLDPDQGAMAKITLSPLMAELWGFQVGEPSGLPLLAKLSPQAQEWLTHPELHDPLGVAGDILVAIAKLQGVNLVADLADDFNPYAAIERSRTTVDPEKALQALSVLMVREDAPGWIAMAPDFATDCWRERADRDLAGEFVRTTLGQGRITLDQYAAYAKPNDHSYGCLAALMDCSNVNLAAVGADDRLGTGIDAVRVIHGLSLVQRDAATREGGITLPLSGEVSRLLSNLMLSGEAVELDQEQDSMSSEADSSFPARGVSGDSDGEQEVSDYDLARTLWHTADDLGKACDHLIQIAGNGVPNGSKLQVERTDQDVVYGYLESGACNSVTPGSLASRIRSVEIAEQRKAKPRPRYLAFRKGTRQRYACTLRFPGGWKLQASASVIDIDAHRPTMTYDQLPVAFRNEVDRSLALMRAPKGPSPGGGNGDPSKPPPRG